MATKKFIIEVEEGVTKCSFPCPFAGDAYLGYQCKKIDGTCFDDLECVKYNLATMRIKEYDGKTTD